MSRAFVTFRLPDGKTVDLGPGDVIGRHATTALPLDDVRVSEAHALVSQRGDHLKLLSLRGRFAVDGEVHDELSLAAGQIIEFARDVALVVEHVEQPAAVLALRGDRLPQQILAGSNTLLLTPEPQLRARYVGSGAAWIWSSGESWRLRIGSDRARPLGPGDSFKVGDLRFEAVLAPLSATSPTQLRAELASPLRVVARYDTVHIHRDGLCVLTLNGISARLVSELVATGAPIGWTALAAEIWSHEPSRMALRRKLDTNLGRLRNKLRAAKVRTDLVRSDGAGHVELLLLKGDTVEDQT